MRYHLHSLLPEKAFQPRGGRKIGFASGGMTLEGGEYSNYWDNGGAPAPAPDQAPAPIKKEINNIVFMVIF